MNNAANAVANISTIIYFLVISFSCLVSRILRQVLILVERSLRNRQEIRVVVVSLCQRQTAGVAAVEIVHHALHLPVAHEVEPALSFERQLQATLIEHGIDHGILRTMLTSFALFCRSPL